MRTLEVQVGVGRLEGGELTLVSATVDTGAAYCVMPESLLRGLGLAPAEYHTVTGKDGGKTQCGYGMARLGIDGREYPCPVLFGPEGQYVLGKIGLQIFNLKIDSGYDKLIARSMRLTAVNGREGALTLKEKPLKRNFEPQWVKNFLGPAKNRRKMNPVLAWLLISAKIVVFALFYGGSRDAWADYTTGELYPVDEW